MKEGKIFRAVCEDLCDSVVGMVASQGLSHICHIHGWWWWVSGS